MNDTELYIVPTPIGNLDDMTYRAVEVLKEVDLILAEDTRDSKKLLLHYAIDTPLRSYHQFNEHKILDSLIREIKSGTRMALISDAGTPGISDPGFLLVRACLQEGISVSTLPGATALIPALVSSGLPADSFVFEGFLPPKKGRSKKMESLRDEKRTIILYESPHKIGKTLKQLSEILGAERKASVSREISKIYEEHLRGTLGELAEMLENKKNKGEFVIVIEGKRK